jgi:iron complex transport system substrate-binding protein
VPALAQQQPARIVSLVPAVTEMLFAIGAGDRVVGVSSYDDYPPEARSRPRVGALVDPDVERIFSLRPDLVIVYGTQTEFVDRLNRVGVSAFSYEHAGLADIMTTIRRLGERIGRADAARQLADRLDADLAGIRRLVSGRPRPKTALIFGREPGTLRSIHASAGVGFMHDMLEAAGGADLFDDIKRQSVQVSTEMLLARSPDVILEVNAAADWTAERIARERDVWRALAALPAVGANRIYILADERLVIPGPRVVEAVRLMARALHPGQFKE